MRPTAMTTAECQKAVLEVACELARQDTALTQIASSIVLPPDADSMFGLEIASTVEVDLFGTINAVKVDYIQEAVKVLMKEAQITDDMLRVDFKRRVQ